MVYMGVEDSKAQQLLAKEGQPAPQARMARDAQGYAAIELSDDFAQAWRRVGVALDRVGFAVEDRDRSRGLYYVRYQDPLKDQDKKDGWLSKLKFWGSDGKPSEARYLVNVSGAGSASRVAVYNEQGVRDGSDTAQRILTLLFEQLK